MTFKDGLISAFENLETESFGFEIVKIKGKDLFSVALPHQCDDWDILGFDPYGGPGFRSRKEAVKFLVLFIKQATSVLNKLEKGQFDKYCYCADYEYKFVDDKTKKGRYYFRGQLFEIDERYVDQAGFIHNKIVDKEIPPDCVFLKDDDR